MEDSTFCLRISKLTDTLEVVRDVRCSHRMEKRQNHVRMNSESESEQLLREPCREKPGWKRTRTESLRQSEVRKARAGDTSTRSDAVHTRTLTRTRSCAASLKTDESSAIVPHRVALWPSFLLASPCRRFYQLGAGGVEQLDQLLRVFIMGHDVYFSDWFSAGFPICPFLFVGLQPRARTVYCAVGVYPTVRNLTTKSIKTGADGAGP